MYESLYEVSDLGSIRSIDRAVKDRNGVSHNLKGRTLAQHETRWGYMTVWVSKSHVGKLVRVHRIVAMAFLQNPHGLPQVNHIDGNKKNNSSDNLEWMTAGQNISHARKTGLMSIARGERARAAILTESQVVRMRELRTSGARVVDLAAQFGVTKGAVSAIALRRNWKHV